MVLITISMIIVFFCIAFLLVYRRIRVNNLARAWSCLTLLGIFAAWADPQYTNLTRAIAKWHGGIPPYLQWLDGQTPNMLIWMGVAGFFLYITVKAYKRGYI